MEKNEQVKEFEDRLTDLINFFAKEFMLTYAEMVGVMMIKVIALINNIGK